mgnify:CR=1 FL=1
MPRAVILILAVAAALIAGVLALVALGSGGSDGPSSGPTGPTGAAATGASGEAATGPTGATGPAVPIPVEGPLNGVNLTAYTADGYGRPQVRRDIAAIADLGATAITLVPTWYMKGGGSTRIAPDRHKSPTDESLIRAMDWVRQAGLQVVLKPHVDVLDGTFRGEIQPSDRARWFESYNAFVGRYAAIAAEQEADLFVAGTELKSVSADTDPWRQVIATVRQQYPGAVAYAANWDEYEQVQFWDGLDLIGIDAYYPLSGEGAAPTAADLLAAWKPNVDALRSTSERWDRPVLLTEIGYPAQPGGTAHPWEVKRGEGSDPEAQARAYRAALKAFAGADWLVGMSWWSWRADATAEEAPATDYSPEGKPAERALRRAWGG